MKCEICGEKIDVTFLDKPLGTYVRDKNGKRHIVCSMCQKNYTMEEIKEKLPL